MIEAADGPAGRAARGTAGRVDVCVIGHVARDIVAIEGRGERSQPGGSAYYAAIALQRLGARTAVITRLGRADEGFLLGDLRAAEVAVANRPSAATTVFENRYAGRDLDSRSQWVRAIAAPFAVEDVQGLRARAAQLGPLLADDLPTAVLEAVGRRVELLALDAQGMLRAARLGPVRAQAWQDKRQALPHVDILKADADEARLLAGEDSLERAGARLVDDGAREVIITLGSGGSLVFREGAVHAIAAVPPRTAVDPTGCGDTYLAAYLLHRLGSDDLQAAARFAGAAASLALGRSGPFAGRIEDIAALLARPRAAPP